MKLAVIGGKLQGVEVTYLAQCAGYEVGVFDKREDAQAFGMAEEAVVVDLLEESERAQGLLEEYDVIFPAVEDKAVLEAAVKIGNNLQIPVVFDMEAYQISSSKQASNKLFQSLGLPMPESYPSCGYPVILKPDNQSGSSGVIQCFSSEEVEKYSALLPKNTVIQEYLEGRSFSLEVIGDGEQYLFPQITEVVTDQAYDCKRVIAPASLPEEEAAQLYSMGKKLAHALKIKGIFDIEVICHKGTLKILEIDARMPSQTPVSVYHSCGINMVETLVNAAVGNPFLVEAGEKQVVMYQQIMVSEKEIQVLGEHVMADCGRLYHKKDFFGAVAAITDYEPQKEKFCAILITTGSTEREAYHQFLDCVRNIQDALEEKHMFMEG